jgi:serine/threonine protein kinase
VLHSGDDPRRYIVMELVDGPDAGGLLRSPDPLTADQTIRIVPQVCDALAYAP